MGIRQKWLEDIREKLQQANEKAAARTVEIAKNLSEKADEGDVLDATKTMLEVVEFLPSLVLFTINLILDPRASIADKIRIGLLVTFLVSPADLLLMEFIGPIALMDDVVIISYLIYSIVAMFAHLDEEVVRDNWVGNPEHGLRFIELARALAGYGPPMSVRNPGSIMQ